MKRATPLVILLLALSAIAGHLMSKASWIGRVGITFFHKDYNLLKIWWQGAIAVFIIMMILFFVHTALQNNLPRMAAKLSHLALLVAAIAGLYFTSVDFNTNFSHRLLGRRFHYGFYLAWVEWIFICLFFLFKKNRQRLIVTNTNKTETITS